MFWDRVAFVYDIFADVINAKTHRSLCRVVADEIEEDDMSTGTLLSRRFYNGKTKGRRHEVEVLINMQDSPVLSTSIR